MNALEAWRALALKSALEKNPAAEFYLQRSALLYWWFGSHFHAANEENMHLYWELRYNSATRTWIVFGALISMRRGAAFPHVKPLMVETKHDASRATQPILFSIDSDFPALAYHCSLQVTTPNDWRDYELKCIEVTVSKLPQPAPKKIKRCLPAPLAPASNVLLKFDENLSCSAPDAIAGKMVDLPCPHCHGEGATATFAVPNAECERGLTGYALYSCNTLNAIVACATCGGSGVTYQPWYLDEQPALRATAIALTKGSGRVREKRLPCRGSLKNG
jgi:hypothetical protein